MKSESSRRATRVAVMAALAVVASAGGPHPAAVAQDALGTGNALDGNLGTTTGGVNQPGPVTDFRARNLVVTGDVPGGRGFRDTVGYRAAGDFLGDAGSDDLFAFRSVSALSAPNFVLQGRTAELLRFGQDTATIEYRRASSPSGAAEMAQTEPFRRAGLLGDRIRLDWLAQSANSTEVIRESMTPRTVGVQQTPEGRIEYIIDASSLLGVTRTPLDEMLDPAISLYDNLRAREDQEQGRETPPPGGEFRLDFEAMPPELLEAQAIADPADPLADPRKLPIGQSEDYQRVVERIAVRYFEAKNLTFTAEPTLLADLQGEFERLQEELSQEPIPPEPADETGRTTEEDEGDAAVTPGERFAPERLFPLPGETDESRAAEEPARDLAEFGIVLRHGERIDRLASDDDSRFGELMRMAEDSLRGGEYFQAERRFIRALRFVPGHPLATAGQAHAQLGAGLYASAALTLRGLLTRQPEMIDVRYDESLLPNRVRLGRVLDDLQARVQEGRDLLGDGFLLAYVGHQLEDDTLLDAGLEAMSKAEPDDRLVRLLWTVWRPE